MVIVAFDVVFVVDRSFTVLNLHDEFLHHLLNADWNPCVGFIKMDYTFFSFAVTRTCHQSFHSRTCGVSDWDDIPDISYRRFTCPHLHLPSRRPSILCPCPLKRLNRQLPPKRDTLARTCCRWASSSWFARYLRRRHRLVYVHTERRTRTCGKYRRRGCGVDIGEVEDVRFIVASADGWK